MKKYILLILLTTSNIAVANKYIMKINVDEQNISIQDTYDSNGFDKNGLHRDTGTESDGNGYNQEGIRDDVDSNISNSLSHKLSYNYITSINQQVDQSDFIGFSGEITFQKNTATIINVDSRNVISKSSIISSPFSSGNKIIKNNSLFENIYNTGNYTHVDNVYENVQVSYYTDWILSGTSTASGTNPSFSYGSIASSHSTWKYVVNESSYYRTYLLNGSPRYQYNCDYYTKSLRTRTEQRLVSSTETHYTTINNVSVNDTIEVFMPIYLDINIDNNGWENLTLNRDNLSEGKVTFSLEGISAKNIELRINDKGAGLDYTMLQKFSINFKNIR